METYFKLKFYRKIVNSTTFYSEDWISDLLKDIDVENNIDRLLDELDIVSSISVNAYENNGNIDNSFGIMDYFMDRLDLEELLSTVLSDEENLVVYQNILYKMVQLDKFENTDLIHILFNCNVSEDIEMRIYLQFIQNNIEGFLNLMNEKGFEFNNILSIFPD